MATKPPQQLRQRPSEDAIASRAYELFLERGGTHGSDVDDWLRAERELAGQSRRAEQLTRGLVDKAN